MIETKLFYGNTTTSDVYLARSGIYQIECWGGGSANVEIDFSKGAYVSGYIKFQSTIKLYVYVGGEPILGTDGKVFNSGGHTQSCGGGASDVRLVGGEWDDFHSLKSRIIVAGAAGGHDGTYSSEIDYGGSGGGINGFSSSLNSGQGGTQIKGGAGKPNGCFGKGGGNGRIGNVDGNGGGGGGYFGGGGAANDDTYGGGGGSSFISGHPECLAIDPSSTDSCNMKMTDQSIHYSGLYFYNTEMIDGNKEMPSPFGGTEKGHSSYGAVRISLIQKLYCISSCHSFIPKYSLLIFIFEISN